MASVFVPSNTALITGGGSGIGLSLAAKCASAGMKVLVVDCNRENLEKAALTNAITTFEMDVADPDDWNRLKRAVDSELGGEAIVYPMRYSCGD
jgi:short-subunit dehydrogenase involved in D-alanine esterification of teichoic acids